MSPYLYIVCAYLAGSIPVGLILSRLKGKDPRKTGSGNIGATNVMRTAGKTLGLITLLGDALKGLIPVIVAVVQGQPQIIVAATGLAAFLGHLYSLFLRFRGGKGIATSAGVLLALCPPALLINLAVFILVLLKWRYVSLGSLTGAGLMPFTLYVLGAPPEYVGLSVIIAIFTFVKHRENIGRLLRGTEHNITLRKNAP
jgi:acyl phosphate:glycerol-3-phosphate acyltransferase